MGCASCIVQKIKEEASSVERHTLASMNKLDTYDWLEDYNDNENYIFEVRFKNTRKAFFKNENGLDLKLGDIVAVSADHGHDIGIISLKGKLAQIQLKRKGSGRRSSDLKIIYRKARPADVQKWKEARQKDYPTMVKAREIAKSLQLDMKISDVEYQGDKTKAIFYYIAEKRVDFRQLIKKYAEAFRIRIEMMQIGARQEAGMVGGIGSCGRELCCSTWRTDFTSISTSYARIQELPLNAQKLAGQCGKLKCCLTYELDNYLEAKEEFPKELLELDGENGTLFPVSVDILARKISYSYKKEASGEWYAYSVDEVKKFMMLNKKGKKVRTGNDQPEVNDILPKKVRNLNVEKRKKRRK